MKYLIQAIVFAVCYCLDGYLKPFFFDLGYAIGIWISGNPDLGAVIAGLIGGLQVALVYGSGFAVAKRINERRLDGSLRTAPGIKRTASGLLMLLVDTAVTGAAGGQTPFFGSGNLVVPASGAQFLYDLVSLSTFHWMGVLGLVSLIWGLVVFCRRKPAAPRPAPSKFTEEADTTPVPVQPPANPSPKTRFCKLCGDPIDPVTRKCTGCKKQYFRLPTFTDKHWFIAALAVACAVILFLLFALAFQRSSYETRLAELTARVSELEDEVTAKERSIEGYERSDTNLRKEIATKKSAIEKLQAENDDMKEKVQFFDRHAVFVLDDGSKEYHTYDCAWRKYSGLSFWIYNTEAAESKGYKPHFCCD